ncbi:HET-domain-containing protein [Rhizodiscina lignyota]|uniref:HET-domain-containing protein n=1 Tax=Rhizodiscina lignyota TaxID=1504668 RepID=A0A9P4IDB0_9PEZI|nr:HET-domain-containing protein [Rhizodiscina lignyota]
MDVISSPSTYTALFIFALFVLSIAVPLFFFGTFWKPHFQYSALDDGTSQIRLLTLLPSSQRRATIHCTLVPAKLKEGLKYEALSYTWGEPRLVKSIELNGRLFRVTKSLHAALRHLRDARNPRVLWIDAVCINQKDDAEKSKQVARMADIYRTASRVLAWLGSSTNDSDLAVLTLQRLEQVTKVLQKYGKEWNEDRSQLFIKRTLNELADGDIQTAFQLMPNETPEQGQRRLSDRNHAYAYYSRKCKAVIALLSRPWWDRVWIIQEFILAQEVVFQCGDSFFKRNTLDAAKFALDIWTDRFPLADRGRYSALKDALMHIGLLKSVKDQHESTSADEHDLWMGRLSNKSLLYLISHLATRQCGDPRDHIFGVLSLSEDELVKHNLPDYSMKPALVFIKFARTWIEHKKNLDILGLCPDRVFELSGQRGARFSWVPCWDSVPRSTIIKKAIEIGRRMYSAGPPSISDNPFDPGKPAILSVQGFCFDKIGILGDCYPHRERGEATNANIIRHWWKIAERVSPSLYEFWLTIGADLYLGQVRNGPQERQNLQQRIDALFTLGDPWSALANDLMHASLLWECVGNKGLHFSISLCGRMCMVPDAAEPGDLLCILFGAQTPFVLRPFKPGVYRLIGECYVHGVMDGEAMLLHKNGDFEKNTFHIY